MGDHWRTCSGRLRSCLVDEAGVELGSYGWADASSDGKSFAIVEARGGQPRLTARFATDIEARAWVTTKAAERVAA